MYAAAITMDEDGSNQEHMTQLSLLPLYSPHPFRYAIPVTYLLDKHPYYDILFFDLFTE